MQPKFKVGDTVIKTRYMTEDEMSMVGWFPTEDNLELNKPVIVLKVASTYDGISIHDGTSTRWHHGNCFELHNPDKIVDNYPLY